MHALYTKRYFPLYLKLSIEIFHKRYEAASGYTEHPSWILFLVHLHELGVRKLVIVNSEICGNTTKYICFPITANSPSEEFIKSRHLIHKIITITG